MIFHRVALSAAVTTSLMLSAFVPVEAQSPPPLTSDQLLSGGCGAGIRLVRELEPGRYLIDMLVPTASPAPAAVLRVDDRDGHWLYPPTAAAQIVIAVPESASAPINVSVAAAHPARGDDVACRQTVNAPQLTLDRPNVPSAAALLPSSNVVDTPVSCAAPFDKGGTILQRPKLQLPAEVRGMTGLVTLALLVRSDGSVERVRIFSAPSAALGGAMAQNMQQLHVEPATFRCAPVESQIFLSMQMTSSRSH